MIEKQTLITFVDTFGSRLRRARTQLKWTQKQLADASGLSQSAIGNYESGQRSSSRALLRLAETLGVDPQWLESGHPGAAQGYGHGQPSASGLQDVPAPWPFSRTPYRHYLDLTPRDQQMLNRLVDDFIKNCLDSYRKPDPPES